MHKLFKIKSQFDSHYKIKHILNLMTQLIPLLVNYTRKYCTEIYTGVFNNRKKKPQKQQPLDKGTHDEVNAVYSYNDIVFYNKHEETTDPCININESQKLH